MSDSRQLDMANAKFAPEIRFGCVSLAKADKLPLSEVFLDVGKGEMSLTLWGDTPAPWDDVSLVSIRMFKFPAGRAEFDHDLAFFGTDRKSRAKLPDGIPFDDSVLAIKEAPAGWTHEAFACGPRSFIHTYQTKKFAVLVRWMTKAGTVLNHPLFKGVHANLRIVEDQWIAAFPEAGPRRAPKGMAQEQPLGDDLLAELDEALASGRAALGLKAKAKPESAAEAVHNAIDVARGGTKLSDERRTELAVELGAVWGDAVRRALKWEWARMPVSKKETIVSVTSPTRAHAVDPIRLVYDLVGDKKRANNALLLFNMLVEGGLPESPGECVWLS